MYRHKLSDGGALFFFFLSRCEYGRRLENPTSDQARIHPIGPFEISASTPQALRKHKQGQAGVVETSGDRNRIATLFHCFCVVHHVLKTGPAGCHETAN